MELVGVIRHLDEGSQHKMISMTPISITKLPPYVYTKLNDLLCQILPLLIGANQGEIFWKQLNENRVKKLLKVDDKIFLSART